MHETPLDVATAFKALGHSKLVIATAIVLGLALGVLYDIQVRPVIIARALVLLPASDITGNPGTSSPYTSTQMVIAGSRPVLANAGTFVRPHASVSQIRSALTIAAESQNVLQLDVSGSKSQTAIAWANAVASSYIAYVNHLGSAVNSLVKQLKRQAAQLTRDFLATQEQIDLLGGRMAAVKPSSVVGSRDASLLAGLQADEQQVSSQLDSINGQIVNAEVQGSQSAAAMTVLQRAEVLPESRLWMAEFPVGGALLGFALAALIVVVRARRDKSLRLRDAVADAIGVPVLASVTAGAVSRPSEWRRLLDRQRSDPVDTWNSRRVLHRLLDEHRGEQTRGAITVIMLQGDRCALAAAVGLALEAARLGMRVQCELSEVRALDDLRAGALTWARSRGAAGDPGLVIPPDDTAGPTASMTIKLLIAVVDGEGLKLARVGEPTLLVVSAGWATADDLARAALAATAQGNPLLGVLLVNPDRDDATTGLVSALPETRGSRIAEAGWSAGAVAHAGDPQ